MLWLLIKTRFQYYRNFIQYHFNLRTKIYLAIIAGIFLLLLFRSPADIGYNIQYLLQAEFAEKWPGWWSGMLISFYLLLEILAAFTLRSTGDWQILGALPFAKKEVIDYHFLRFVGKTIFLVFVFTIPFFLGPIALLQKIHNFVLAGLTVFVVEQLAFTQAFRFKNQSKKLPLRLTLWISGELVLIVTLIFITPGLAYIFKSVTLLSGALIFILMTINLLLFLLNHRIYNPGLTEAAKSVRIHFTKTVLTEVIYKLLPLPLNGLVQNDFLFLLRKRRTVFIILLGEIFTLSLSCVAQKSAVAGFISSIFIQLFFGWLFLLNSLLHLFERDIETAQIIRVLPVRARQVWLARGLFTAALLALPMIFPCLILGFCFPISWEFLVFAAGSFFGIPALLAVIYCNTGFALYPQAKLTGLLMNIMVMSAVFFWFYMPFGLIFILSVIVIWIRKSQKHFNLVEMS